MSYDRHIEKDVQCARCGSSMDYEECPDCGGDGTIDCFDDDAGGGGVYACDLCNGAGGWHRCLSSPQWCEANPRPGHEHTPPSTAEWFEVQP